MSTILVTGGRGAVGVPLVEELRRRGHTVRVCDLAHAGDENYVRCDVGRYRQVEELFARDRFDYVYHLAAEFGRWNGEDYYEAGNPEALMEPSRRKSLTRRIMTRSSTAGKNGPRGSLRS
jgi:nucleoside-diphosphate-sugar epimerase